MNKTARNFLLDNLFSMSAYWVGAGTVIASLTSYYQVPLSLANLITGFTSTVLIVQLLGGLVYTRTRHRTFFVRLFNILWRLCLPGTFLSVLLPPSAGVWVMGICYFLSVALYQFVTPAQTEWMVDSVAGQVKKNYFSIRELAFMLGYSGGFCFANLALNVAQKAEKMQQAFVVIGLFLALLLGSSLISLLRLPPPEPAEAREARQGGLMGSVFQNKPFMQVLLTYSAWYFACMFISSFGSVYQIRVLHLSFTQILVWATVGNLARSLLIPVMGRLALGVGWRRVTLLCMSSMLTGALVWFFIRPENALLLFPLVSVLVAIPNAGLSVGFLQLQVDTTPEKTRSVFFSANAVANGLAAMAGSGLCSALIAGIEGAFPLGATPYLRYVFLLGALGIAVTMLLARRMPVGK